ncbi:RDD family protein [Roseibacterium beibuensis]|nr:RDD family protein [Roseibacterium beibuensis]MCS6621590.1 RDD family protein [Roseibacterium beibuensis]
MTYNSALPDPDYDHAYYDGVPAKRLFAWVIDVLIVTLITLVLGVITLTALLWIWPVVYVTVAFLYRWGSVATWSATLGMRLMNLQLRGRTGHVLSTGEAAAHTGLYLFLSASMILQLVSVGAIALSQRHQGLHDLILGTAALNRPQ